MVEYPLRDIERQELQDGRVAGVGLVVGRNMDRGDAGKLPEDQLDLCEIEPLRQEEPGSTRWAAMHPNPWRFSDGGHHHMHAGAKP